MYAHQVIENVIPFKWEDDDFLHDMTYLIKEAQKFHVPDPEILYDLLIGDRDPVDDPAFLEKIIKNYCYPPYKLCWFDYFSELYKAKIGTVVHQTADSLLDVYMFYSLNRNWRLYPISWRIKIDRETLPSQYRPLDDISWGVEVCGECFCDDNELEEYMTQGDGRLFNDEDEFAWDIVHILTTLNIKNIKKEKTEAPTKLNKKRIKNGKTSIYSYYTLKIDILKSKNETEQTALSTEESFNRLHLCRGHVKEYSDKKPLFGKIKGLYYWKPHVRGRNKKGIVMKDYEVQNDK